MIRGLACLAVVLIAAALGGSALQTSNHATSLHATLPRLVNPTDPINYTGASNAFNFTYSTADIYPISNATSITPAPNSTGTGTLNYFSTVKHTIDGSPIPGTAFNFTANPTPSPNRQELNWTLTIPKPNCSTCDLFVQFTLYGNLTKGTSENFTLTSTKDNSPAFPLKRSQFLGNHTSPVYVCGLSAGTSGFCFQPTAEINVDSWVGYTLRLSFRFGWNATTEAMIASVGEVRVAQIDHLVKSIGQGNNVMTQTSANTITHHATFLSLINYNATVQYPVNNTSTIQPHVWKNEVINFYYPSGYNITQLAINSTTGPPTPLFPSGKVVPFETNNCFDAPCSEALVAINMSDFQAPKSPFVRNSTIYLTAVSPASVIHLNTETAGGATTFFSPGETLGVNVTNSPSVRNMTATAKQGTLSVSVTDPTGAPLPGSPSATLTSTGGISNFTLPLNCGTSASKCGIWNVNATFVSLFDLGHLLGSFRVDQLQVGSFSSSGSNTGLTVHGTLAYATNTTTIPAGVPGIVFAEDAGSAANIPLPPTTNSSNGKGLYIANATLVNGLFTQGQSLIMIFTIANATSQPVNATLRIEHEWPGSPAQTHGVFANFTIGAPNDGLSDLPFARGPQTYQATITLTPNGIQVALALATSPQSSLTKTMSLGSSLVPSTAQHAGLFKITVATRSGSSILVNSLESPPYAYVYAASVLGIPLAPGRALAYSKPFNTTATGSFSVSIASSAILGAKRLALFALGRDGSGLIIENSAKSPGFSDSTILQARMDSIGQVAEGQTVTATLHLTNNSTSITAVVTVNLNLQGSKVPVASTGVSLQPGMSQPVALSFKAPSTAGQYILTFSSPQYQNGAALVGQTLQVVIVQSNLQILIPAAIGIVVAIIVLGTYLIRRGPEKTEEAMEKTRPPSPKPKPKSPTGNPPTKSLTPTGGLDQ